MTRLSTPNLGSLHVGLLRAGLVLSALAMGGCSLLVDTSPYVGNGARDAGPLPDGALPDAGPFDGALPDAGPLPDGDLPDARVDPDGPTQPVVSIAPSAPTTVDALVMSIDTESTDPLNAGPLTYEIVWERDTLDSGVTTDTVEPSATAKGQTWRVIVTPVASDGRRGAPGVASVTVLNTPPEIDWVRLDSYRPVIGDSLLARSGPTFDEDGDAVGVTYAWYRNDELIPGQTTNRLETGAVPAWLPGDEFVVEATVRDSETDGDTVSAGPAVTVPDVTRWRQLLPNRAWDSPHLVAHDPLNERVLLFSQDDPGDTSTLRLWELALDGTGDFTQLFPAGDRPHIQLSQAVWDSVNERLLIIASDFDAAPSVVTVYAVDVSERGGETITELSLIGAPPPGRLLSSVMFDEAHERLVLYSGLELSSGEARHDLWTLDVSTPGSESWTQQLVTLPPIPILGGALVNDAARNRALLISGGEYESGGGDPPPSANIFSLALDDLSLGFVQEASSVTGGRFLATSGVDVAGDRAIVAYGGQPGDVFPSDWIVVELSSLISTVVTPTGEGPEGGGRGFLSEDSDGNLLLYPGAPYVDATAQLELFTIESGSSALTPVYRIGVDGPPGLAEAIVGDRQMTIFGGVDHRGDYRADVWRMTNGRLAPVVVQPDAVDGSTPSPRGGAILQQSSQFGADLQFFGGRGESGVADGRAWLLRSDRWTHNTLATGEFAPRGREGVTFWRAACGNDRVGYFGGRDATGAYSDFTENLACSSGDRDCAWTDPVDRARPLPPARAWATASRLNDTSDVVLFGGRGSTALFDDVWLFNVCGGGLQPWRAASVTGARPARRWGHSMVLANDRDQAGMLERLLVFGGGSTTSENSGELGDALMLTHTTGDSYRWAPVVIGTGPFADTISPRLHHAAGWDEPNQRMLVYGGRGNREIYSDLWELRLR